MREKLDAAAFALAVFAFLYLAEGLRLFAGYSWWFVLAWPGQMVVSLGRVAAFLFIPFAAVSLLVYRLRLQGLQYNQSLGSSGVSGSSGDKAIAANAVLTALAVFLVLYLALAVGMGGFRHWTALLWPLDLWGNFTRFVLFALAASTGVSLFVWWLKGCYLYAAQAYDSLARGSQRELSDIFLRVQLEACQKELAELRANAGRASPDSERDVEMVALRGKVKTLQANLENETRQSAQARMRAAEAEAKLRDAEIRAAAAETNARYARQRAEGAGEERPPPPDEAAADKGGDAKFKRAKRAFAKRYHPDNRPEGGIERTILAEIYKEFWQVLEAIEADKPLP